MKKNSFLFNKRLKVLKFAKIIVTEKGFKSNTLKLISDTYNLDKNEIDLLFPEGNKDLIKFSLEQLNQDLEDYCKKITLIRLPLNKRIRKIMLIKISLMKKEKKFYKNIFLNILIPKRHFSITSQLYKTVDQIWFIAGDTSTDFNFYTKRLILAGIYSRVILFFFNNNDQIILEKILDTNLKRVAKIPELKSKINLLKNNFPNILKLIKTFN